MNSAPQHWLRVSLDQIGVWRGGGTPTKSHSAFWSKGTVPWVSPKDVKQTYIDSATDRVTQQAVEETGLQIVPPGSILIVCRSSILGRTLPVAVTTVPVVVNQDIKALIPGTDVDPLFLQQQLSYLENVVLQSTVKLGTTVQSINFEALKNIQIALPPYLEQRAISERLSTIRASLNSAQALLLSVFKLVDVYQRAFLVRALSSTHTEGAAHPNGSPAIREVTLGDIADIQSGLTLGKRHGSVELTSRPYLRVANVQRGYLDLDHIREVLVTPTEAERYKLTSGDILMNEGGDRDKLGRGWVWKDEIPSCLHQNHIFRIRLHDHNFPPEFISLYANEVGRDYFLSEAKQTTNLASISKSKLSALPIKLPSAEEAQAVLNAYDEQNRRTEIVRSQVQSAMTATYAALRAASRRAFEGRLVSRLVGEPLPSLISPDLSSRRNLKRSPKRHSVKKGSAMTTLNEFLEQWPDKGISFDELRERVPGDYENLKDAIFELLTGENPLLEQRYDLQNDAMRLFRRAK